MPSKKAAASTSLVGGSAASDTDIIGFALELAKLVGVPAKEAQIPSPHSASDEPDTEWPKEEEAFWAVKAPAGKDPVTVLVDSNGSVRGVVPGDGVTLEDGKGVPHSVGVVSQMSVREGKVRVLVERVRPIESSD